MEIAIFVDQVNLLSSAKLQKFADLFSELILLLCSAMFTGSLSLIAQHNIIDHCRIKASVIHYMGKHVSVFCSRLFDNFDSLCSVFKR